MIRNPNIGGKSIEACAAQGAQYEGKTQSEVETCITELHSTLNRVLEAVNFLGGRLSPVLSNQQPETAPVSRPMPVTTCHVSSMINEAHDTAMTCEQYLNNLIAALRV